MQQDIEYSARSKELRRVYSYLERHITPKDIPLVRWAFDMSIESRNTAQLEMAVATTED